MIRIWITLNDENKIDFKEKKTAIFEARVSVDNDSLINLNLLKIQSSLYTKDRVPHV
jgi:hypothetical protein